MDNLISLENLYNSLKDIIESREDIEKIRDIIAHLHFIIQNKKLSADIELDIDIEPLERIATYLLSILTNVTSIKMKEYISGFYKDGLNIAGLIFELLSELYIIEPIQKHYYFFYCSISYSLAYKEASSAVISKRMLENIELNKLFIEKVEIRHCWFYIGRTLSRDFKGLCRMVNKRYIFKAKFNNYNNIWNKLRDILLLNAIAFIDGKDTDEIFEGLSDIKRNLLVEDNIEDLLIVSLLYETIEVMHRKSVWTVLADYGFSNEYILTLSKYDRDNIYEIWTSQLNALSNNEYGINYLDTEVRNAIITMPTSSGKSFLAELAIIKSLEKNSDMKCIYVAPSRALCGEIEERLFLRLRRLGYRVSSIIDTDDNEFENEYVDNSHVIVLTPEKLDLLIRRNKDIVDFIGLVIFDEFHKITSDTRGWLLETLITWFLINQERNCTKIILMSAIVGNADDINIWIGNELFGPIVSDWSPNRRVYATLIEDKDKIFKRSNFALRYRYNNILKENKDVFIISEEEGWTKFDICHRFIQYLNDDKILIFFYQKDELEWFIKRASTYMRIQNNMHLIRLKSFLSQKLGEEHSLTKNIEYGIAYHHGDLPLEVRKEVERHYKAGHISVLASTSTLSDGVNLPIKNFILGSFRTYNDYKISEGDFKNIVGRAGRAYVDTEGRIFIMGYNEYSYGENKRYIRKLLNVDNYSSTINSTLTSKIYSIEEILFKIEELMELSDIENKAYIIDYIDRLQVFIFSLVEEFGDMESIDYDKLGQYIEKLLVYQEIRDNIDLLETFKRSCEYYINYANGMDKIKLNKYNKTGLSYRSNNLVEEIANEIIRNDYFEAVSVETIITKECFDKLIAIKEFAPIKIINKKEEVIINHYNLFLDWINGSSFLDLRERYFNIYKDISKRTMICSNYIQGMFFYKLPWVFSSLYSFVKGNTLISELIIKYIPAMVKYGVINIDAIRLCTIGIESRDLVNKLAILYEKNNRFNQYNSIEEWIIDKSFFYFERNIDNIDELTIRQIARVRTKLRLRTNYLINSELDIEVAGLPFYDFKSIYKDNKIKIGQRVMLLKEDNNPYDEFAVKVMLARQQLGYIPAIYSEEIYYYLEGGIGLTCEVIEIAARKLVVSISLDSY